MSNDTVSKVSMSAIPEIDSTVAAMAEQAEPSNYEPLSPTVILGPPPIVIGAPAAATLGAPPITMGTPAATTLGAPPITMGTPAATTLGAPPITMGTPVSTFGAPGASPGVLVAALEAPTVALGPPVSTLGAPVITQGIPEPIHFIPAVSLATPPQSTRMASGGMASGGATQPSSPAYPEDNVSDALIPAAPVQSVRHIQGVTQTARLRRKRKGINGEEESRLFCSWLISDTAKNETKTSLMALKQEKVRLEIFKLKRQLMVD